MRSRIGYIDICKMYKSLCMREFFLPSSAIKFMMLLAGTNSARVNFGFNQYSSSSDIINAIKNLPRIVGSGNDVAGAILTLQNQVFVSCPLRNNSQCVAMILYDNNADSAVAANAAAQVRLNYLNTYVQYVHSRCISKCMQFPTFSRTLVISCCSPKPFAKDA
jgi:von Willebrand factor type A domain